MNKWQQAVVLKFNSAYWTRKYKTEPPFTARRGLLAVADGIEALVDECGGAVSRAQMLEIFLNAGQR